MNSRQKSVMEQVCNLRTQAATKFAKSVQLNFIDLQCSQTCQNPWKVCDTCGLFSRLWAPLVIGYIAAPTSTQSACTPCSYTCPKPGTLSQNICTTSTTCTQKSSTQLCHTWAVNPKPYVRLVFTFYLPKETQLLNT